jgi:hypothetical protein
LYLSGALVGVGLNDTLSSSISIFFTVNDVLTAKTVISSADTLVSYVNNKFSDILVFSDLLYTYHCFLFFISALLLLTAMLGAIILATSASDEQNPVIEPANPLAKPKQRSLSSTKGLY